MLLSFRGSEMQVTAISAPCNVFLNRLALLITVFCTLAATGCTDLSEFENEQIENAFNDSLLTSTVSEQVRMEIIEEGLLKVRLKAQSTESVNNENRNLTRMSGPVYIEIFGDRGQREMQVESDSAINYPNRSEFELFGNVRVITTDGRRLYTDFLKWQRTEDRVSTPEFVTFIDPPDSISAEGFFGKTDLTEYTLNKGGGKAIIE